MQSTEFILRRKRYKIFTRLNIISNTVIIMSLRNDHDASVHFGSYSLEPCLIPFYHLHSLSFNPSIFFLPIYNDNNNNKVIRVEGRYSFWPCKSVCLIYLFIYGGGTGFPYCKETMGFKWKMMDCIKVQ